MELNGVQIIMCEPRYHLGEAPAKISYISEKGIKVTKHLCGVCGEICKHSYAFDCDYRLWAESGGAHYAFCDKCEKKLRPLFKKLYNEAIVEVIELRAQKTKGDE